MEWAHLTVTLLAYFVGAAGLIGGLIVLILD